MGIGLRSCSTCHSLRSMSKSTFFQRFRWICVADFRQGTGAAPCGGLRLTDGVNRILDNAHLLDATEIFRKLNVHKKVRDSYSATESVAGQLEKSRAKLNLGIVHQAWLPLGHVLLLP